MTQIEATSDTIVGHLIGGKSIADSARTQAVYNPATGEISKQVTLARQY